MAQVQSLHDRDSDMVAAVQSPLGSITTIQRGSCLSAFKSVYSTSNLKGLPPEGPTSFGAPFQKASQTNMFRFANHLAEIPKTVTKSMIRNPTDAGRKSMKLGKA